MPELDLQRIGRGLPVAEHRRELSDALRAGAAVVQAPPGTGKTTFVPPLLATLLAGDDLPGRVVVTQPRRIAARAAARRLAQLTGLRLGQEVGFTVRGESRTSAATRVEFVTTGVLVRRLLADPSLDGVAGVVLDEVHERHLDSDLAFGMLVELRELRPELALVAMSATLDAPRWAGLLGGDVPAPVVEVPSVLHPLTVRWAPPPPGVPRMDARGMTPGFLDHVAARVVDALDEPLPQDADGSGAAGDGGPRARLLAFLPGAREVRQVVERLQSRGVDAGQLTGGMDGREQDRVLSPDGPRVVVATSVAESSVTVPGVRLVVDAGLAREPRRDQARGMSGLVTVSEARSSAEQRAGRAARLGPGVAVRLFPERDWAGMRSFTTPEVATADLTRAVLDLACWGAPGGVGLALPDPLPEASLEQATSVLRGLGALDQDGRATALGRRIARIPADPRLARALLLGAPLVGRRAAAQAVALLTGDERAPGGDLAALLDEFSRGKHPGSGRWRAESERLEGMLDQSGEATDTRGEAGLTAGSLGLVVALAHPDRVARRRGGESGAAGQEQHTYLTTGGTGVALERGSGLRGQEWLAVAEMGRAHTGDGTGALARAAVPITREVAEEACHDLFDDRTVARWQRGRVVARRVQALGAVELTSSPVAPTADQARAAVLQALAEQGLGGEAVDESGAVTPGLLDWDEHALSLRRRLAVLHRELGEPWPAMDSASLLARADEWLGPVLDAVGSGRRPQLAHALRSLLPWPEAGRLDELAPERLEVPTGSLVRLDYPALPSGRVVLAVKLQECFGLVATPRIVDGRVPVLLHLLSPARRPLAITDDLASFWTSAYPSVRAENRGRYPKHPWPEDPLTAPPRRGTTRSGR